MKLHVTEVRPRFESAGTIDALALGPDGRRIAIAVSGARDAGLYAGEVGSDRFTKLVGYPSWRSPRLAWSPSGDFVAYQIEMDPPGGYDDQVGVVRSDQRGDHLRTGGQAFAWAASGGSILYVTNGAELQVERHDVPKKRSRPLGEFGHHYSAIYRPAVVPSTDGSHVVYTSRNVLQETTYVYCMGKKEGLVQAEIVTRVPGTEAHVLPFWSPGGKTLGLHIVHVDYEQTGTVIIKGLEGEGEIYYSREAVDVAVAPAWCPVNKGIAVMQQGDVLAWIDVDTRQVTPLLEPGEVRGAPRFLADGRLVLEGEGVAYVVDGFGE